jgi:hypothetical protein
MVEDGAAREEHDTMDIYVFFNSPDVAQYCREIGHNFNALETAVMVSESKKRTLAEKIAAYRTIIAEYPDMEIPKACNHKHIKSFHKALAKVIADDEQLLKLFLTPEPGALYQASIDMKKSSESYSRDSWELKLFSDYEKALTNALEWLEGEMEYKEFSSMSIRKKYINSGDYINAAVSSSGEIIEVWQNGEILPVEGMDLLQACYIDVPVPFKRGDLVEVDKGGYMGEVYVLQNLCRDDAESHARRFRGDISDMTAYVFYESEGAINCDCMHFYPNLRYCRRELSGQTRMLKYVSLFMQEKLCLCHLLKLQKYCLLDEMIRDIKDDVCLKTDLEVQEIQLGESAPLDEKDEKGEDT